MKKFYLTVVTALLHGIIAAQVGEEKYSSLAIMNYHNNIGTESKVFPFDGRCYEHLVNQSYNDYLQKSKNQKTWAWILTGAGVGIVTVGLLTQDYVDAFSGMAEETNSASPAVYVVGGACITGGIVLFAASSRNRKKAMSSSAILRMERAVVAHPNSAFINFYPAAGLRINYR